MQVKKQGLFFYEVGLLSKEVDIRTKYIFLLLQRKILLGCNTIISCMIVPQRFYLYYFCKVCNTELA